MFRDVTLIFIGNMSEDTFSYVATHFIRITGNGINIHKGWHFVNSNVLHMLILQDFSEI